MHGFFMIFGTHHTGKFTMLRAMYIPYLVT